MSDRRRPPRGPSLAGLVALACLPLALLSGHCSLECTELGCGGSLGLQVTTPDATWPVGTYTLTVTADGQTTTCTLALTEPLAPSDSRRFTCDRAAEAALSNEMREEDRGDVLTLVPVPGRYQLTGYLQEQPARVQVELRRDDQTLLTSEQTPAYEEREINGPGCGTCRLGSVALATGGAG